MMHRRSRSRTRSRTRSPRRTLLNQFFLCQYTKHFFVPLAIFRTTRYNHRAVERFVSLWKCIKPGCKRLQFGMICYIIIYNLNQSSSGHVIKTESILHMVIVLVVLVLVVLVLVELVLVLVLVELVLVELVLMNPTVEAVYSGGPNLIHAYKSLSYIHNTGFITFY
jgi:hypothetical protein